MKPINHTFFTRKVQEINALPDGTIKRSTDTLFTIFTGENLYDLHPFFEGLREEIQEGTRNYLVFPCITLDFEDNKKSLVSNFQSPETIGPFPAQRWNRAGPGCYK